MALRIRERAALAVAALGLMAGAAGVASAQQYPYPNQPYPYRTPNPYFTPIGPNPYPYPNGNYPYPNGGYNNGQHASNSDIWHERRRVEIAIDHLQNDARDYGGHRERAIDLLQRARRELLDAEQFARSRGY